MEAQKNEFNYGLSLNPNQKAIGKFGENEGFNLQKAGITKSASFPELGFSSLKRDNEYFLICTKFTETSKSWNSLTKMN